MLRWFVVGLAFLLGLVSGVALVVTYANKARRMANARAAHYEALRQATLQPPWLPARDALSAAAARWPLVPSQSAASPVSLGQFGGRPIFLSFWATWCAPCIAEMPAIARLSRQPGAAGTSFVLVSTENPEVVRAFLHRTPLSVPSYVACAPVPPDFAAAGLPATFIMDRDGRVVVRHVGAAKWDDPSVTSFLSDLAAMHR